MSEKSKKDWIYIWGVGWFDPNDTGVLPFSLRRVFSGVLGILILLVLVLFGLFVVESVFPGLPWLE